MQKTAVVLATVASALGLSWLLSFIELEWNQSLYGFFGFFVIPIGAIGCGLAAGLGMFATSRLLNVKPTGALRALPWLVSVIVFFATSWFTWYFLGQRGIRSDAVGFTTYLQASIENAGYSVGTGSNGSGSNIDRLGMWGYGLSVLQLLGFAGGAYVLIAALDGSPYCPTDQRYLSKESSTTATFEDLGPYEQMIGATADLLTAEDIDGIAAFAAQEMAATSSKKRKIRHRLTASVHRCGRCHGRRAMIKAESVNGNNSRVDYEQATELVGAQPTMAR